MTPEHLKRIDELTRNSFNLSKELQKEWMKGTIFTWHWWLLVALTVLPWVFWIFWHKKDSTNRLLYAGFFSILVAKLLDVLGATFGFWEYTAKVIPLMPPLFPWDSTLMPVTVMTFIQYKPKISPYIKAITFAAIASFVMEPAAVWLGLYKPLLWKHIYSFPIFAVIYLAANWLSRRERFEQIQAKKS